MNTWTITPEVARTAPALLLHLHRGDREAFDATVALVDGEELLTAVLSLAYAMCRQTAAATGSDVGQMLSALALAAEVSE